MQPLALLRVPWPPARVIRRTAAAGEAGSGTEWLYPAGALRLTLGGSESSAGARIACLWPAQPFEGAQVFVELAGGTVELLLLAEGLGPSEGRYVCWGPCEGRALFLQATPHRNISRRVASFGFELSEDRRPELPPQAHGLGAYGACRPCSDVASCTSNFVIHGTIHGAVHDTELQESLITITVSRFSARLPLFPVGALGARPPFALRYTVVSALAWEPSSSWAGAALVRPGLAVPLLRGIQPCLCSCPC